jgi:rsbT co-antagonist protein RsbR
LLESETRIVLQRVEGVLIVPFPDPLDHAFLGGLQPALLAYVHRQPVSGLIFDLSGVEAMDKQDFETIRMACDAVRLMGAPVVLSGLKPGVAAALVMMGTDASGVGSALTVDMAMETLK